MEFPRLSGYMCFYYYYFFFNACINTLNHVHLSCHIDMKGGHIWSQVHSFQNPDLQVLAGSLLDTVLNSRATSTSTKYLYAIRRWRLWAQSQPEITEFPIKDLHMALYLQHLASIQGSLSAVEEAYNALSWLHRVACQDPFTNSPILQSTLDGLRRQLAAPRRKKEPVTIEMLQKLAGDIGRFPSLAQSRLLTICLLSFAGFLRYDEITKLRCCDVSFQDGHLQLKITSSKTDQLREGAVVVITKTKSDTCPVSRLQEYIRIASINLSSKERLFRGIIKTKRGEHLRKGGSFSYTRFRELLMEKFKELGYDTARLGVHSFRSGGATQAANSGVPDRLFKRHGRWRSENAKDGYIKDSLEARLSVSAQLGL